MRLLQTILLVVFTTLSLFAQDPVKWKTSFKHLDGKEYELTFKAKIQDGWYTYSQFISDDGPVPTSINFESGNEEKVGKATETTSKASYKIAGHDEMFDMEIIKYKKDLTIKQKISVLDPNKKVTGYLEFMTCDDTRCMPPTAVEFSFNPIDFVKADPSSTKENDQGNTDKVETEEEVPTETVETNTTEDEQNNGLAATPTDNKPVVWAINFEKIDEDEVKLIAKAAIADGWYLYSQKLEGDDGPLPTTISFEEGIEVEVINNEENASTPSYKVAGHDEMFDMEIIKYKHDLTIVQHLKAKDPTKPIKGFLEFMTCDDTKCMPPTLEEFAFSFSGDLTVSAKEETNGTVVGNKFNPIRPTLIKTNKSPIGNCDGTTGDKVENDDKVVGMSWLAIFLAGFGGGLLALLTPCVFPMIPMTVSLFSKGKKKSNAEGITNALIFGASIIVIYVSLGLIITFAFGADALNQLSTHWLMNLAFFLLFTIFAISFFGYFEIQLPASWANKADQASMRGGLIGSFFGAFSIALVSFSCTGPIVGTLLVQAAVNGGIGGPAIGMLGFSIALALPFTLFAAFPSWLQSLPNSGGWMTTMKVVLGFLELALGLKFLSTADLTEHWGILPYEAFIGLWAVIFGAMTLYLFGFIRFPHDNPMAKISTQRKLFAGLTGLFTIYILSGFMTNSKGTFVTPSLLSGLAPAACYSYILPCDCPANLDECFHDYDEALKHAKKVNKPLFIDFTGYGCVNCRKMEENVWIEKEVNDLIRDEYVLVSLYVDDREKLPQTLEGPNGRKIRNVGNKWAVFQEVNFDRQSQPYYVLVNTKEEVLNKPVGYTPDVDTYKAFLECGVTQFKASMAQE